MIQETVGPRLTMREKKSVTLVLLVFLVSLKKSLSTPHSKHDPKRSKYKGTFSIDCRERESHEHCVYPTQNTPRMETARVKQEEKADTRIIVIEYYRIWKKRGM